MKTTLATLWISVSSGARWVLPLLMVSPALAQPKPPTLERFFPAGGPIGEAVEISAEGSFERWPVEVWVDRPGLDVSAGEEKGTLLIKVADDAIPGRYLIRLHDSGGATSLRSFFVGTLPEVVEVEPNDNPKAPQVLDQPGVVLNGRLSRNGDVDGYSIPLKAGQTLVAALEAHGGLGSPMDGVLQVVTSEGFVLAQEDDSPGLDPLLIFEVPADGDYIVRTFAFPETPTSTIGFAGGDAFVYRLTLTTDGYVDYAHPSALSGEETTEVDLIGWNIPESARRLTLLSEGDAESEQVWAFHPEVANGVSVPRLEHPALAEEAVSGPIARPITISGRIDQDDPVDSFAFEAKEGETIVFQVEARGLGSPLDPLLRVSDASGQSLAEQDDNRRDLDPSLSFKALAEGTYFVSIRDLHDRGGPRFFYRLTAREPVPDFALSTSADHFELIPGKPLEITVAVDRPGNFGEPIEIHIEGLPEEVSAQPATSEPKGDSSKQVKLVLESAELTFGGPIRIVGRGGDVERTLKNLWLTVVTASEVEPAEDDRQGRREGVTGDGSCSAIGDRFYWTVSIPEDKVQRTEE